jgi:hypothetical protein
MAIAQRLPSLSNSTRRIQHVPFGVAIGAKMALSLGKPAVVELMVPAPVRAAGLGEDPVDPAKNMQTAINALTTTVGAGTKFYLQREDMKQAQAAANAAQSQADAARRSAELQAQLDREAARAAQLAAASAPKGLPSWVLPVSIAAVAIFGLGTVYFMKKKKV